MMEIALLENIQRENLTPLEEAHAYYNIINKSNITQDELAQKIGKDRTYITNMLGLLRLPDNIQDLVDNKKLSMSHARLLSKLSDEEQIIDLAKRVIDENLSVRVLEELCQSNKVVKTNKINRKPSPNNEFIVYQEMLQEKLGTRVKIKNDKIEISFHNHDDLVKILNNLDLDIEG